MIRVCLGGLMLVSAAACGGGQSSPTAPTPLTVLSVVIPDPPVFTGPNQSSQLTAVASLSNATTLTVTRSAAWQSSNPSAVSVSSTGLASAIGTGTATISVTYLGTTGSANVSVSPGTGRIAGCGEYHGTGSFVVDSDITAPGRPSCVNFVDMTGITLDCQGHDIASIHLVRVNGFNVRNCLMHGGLADFANRLINLVIEDSTAVVLEADDVRGQALVLNCTGCAFRSSSFVYPENGFQPSQVGILCEICISSGRNNQIVDNVIDGAYNGNLATYEKQGADDGILFYDEAGIVIRGNTIRRAYDAGIEPTRGESPAPITAIIQDNRISDTGYTGIGAYYIAGWQDSVISGNAVSNSPSLAHLDAVSASLHGLQAATFVNNQFVGNTLRNQAPTPPRFLQANATAATLDFTTAGIPFTVSGNVIRGNDFGTTTGAPIIAPATGFVDGGGNVCQPGGFLICLGAADARLGLSRAIPAPSAGPHRHPGPPFVPRPVDRRRR